MIEIIKELNIEVSKPNVFQAVVAKQYDMNTRFIKATFVDFGEKITIPKSDTVQVIINALRPDGESQGFDGVINDDGTVTVPLHSWMLELVGTVTCDISVIDTKADNGKRLTTTSFTLLVEQAAWGNEGITNDPQYSLLIELLNTCEAAGEVAEEALRKSNEANSKYYECVAVTSAAREIVEHNDAIIGAMNSRLDTAISALPSGGAVTETFTTVLRNNSGGEDTGVECTFRSNGAVSRASVKLAEGLRISPSGWLHTDAFIPSHFIPMEDVEVEVNTTIYPIRVVIESTPMENGCARIRVENTDENTTVFTATDLTADGKYDLSTIAAPELADARDGYDGTKYDTLGQAIRGQVLGLNDRIGTLSGGLNSNATKIDKLAQQMAEEAGDLNKGIEDLQKQVHDIQEDIAYDSDGQAHIEGTDVEKTCIKFAGLLYDTDKAESFIFCTDPHVCNPPNKDAENKMLTSFGILKTYYDATPTNFVLCGGDWLNDVAGQTNEDACYKLGRAASWMRANFDRFYTAIGNHEDNYPFGASHEGAGRYTVERGLSMETIRNLMLPDEKELYYSFDGAHTKFYVMNSSDVETDTTMTDYRWGQVSWLAQRLKEDDAENSAIVMHAILLRPIGDGVFAHLAKNLLQLCEAYNNSTTIKLNGVTYDFTDCTGCVRFAMAGHIHDTNCVEIHYGIPVILTQNMMASADRSEGYKPCFDLCLADYDKEIIRMMRVGPYGMDRDAFMASRTFKGNTYAVQQSLTNSTAGNSAVNVREGDSYSCVLAAKVGYAIVSVQVTMGGTDITSTAYSNGQVSISNVTGDIVITAIADARTYDVTLNLTNVTAGNAAKVVDGGAKYENVLIAISGNLAVSVMMGGVDITATSYKNGVVTIENVTGAIIITAKTVSYTNLVDLTSEDWSNTAKWDDNVDHRFSNNGSGVVTNFIPVKMNDNLRFYGFDTETKFDGQEPMLAFFDENKNYLTSTRLRLDASNRGTSSGVTVDAAPDENGVVTYRVLTYGRGIHMSYASQCYNARYVRINARPAVPVSEIVVTLNEEIFAYEKGNNLADTDSPEWVTSACLKVSNKVMSIAYLNTTEYAMGTVTNCIPLVHGDVLRVKGFDWETSNYGNGVRLYFLDENYDYVTYLNLRSEAYNTADGVPSAAIDENGVLTYNAYIRADNNLEYTYNQVSTRTKYVRISARRIVPEDEIVITVNNPIE